MSHPAALDHQHYPVLPPIPSIAGLVPTAACDGRLIWKSRLGTLPTAAELHAGNVARAVDGDGAAVLADLGRKLAPMLRAARADLAAAKVRS